MNKLFKILGLGVLGASVSLAVQADGLDGIKVAVGDGSESSDVYQIAVLSDFGQSFFDNKLKLHWETGYTHWSADSGANQDIDVFSISPIFTYELGSADQGYVPYVDFSIGIAYLSDTEIGSKKLGQHFQFDDRLSVGVRFGGELEHDVALGVRHVSNASMDDDNDGFDAVSLAYSFRF